MDKKISDWMESRYFIMLERGESHSIDLEPRCEGERIAIGKHLNRAKRIENFVRKKTGVELKYEGCYPNDEEVKGILKTLES